MFPLARNYSCVGNRVSFIQGTRNSSSLRNGVSFIQGTMICSLVGKQGFLYEWDQEFFYGEEQGFVQKFFYCRKKGYFYLGKAIWREGLTNVTQWRWLANINVAHAQLFLLYSVRVSQARLI